MARDLIAEYPRLRLLTYRTMLGLGEAMPLWLLRAIAYASGIIAWWCDARGRRTVANNLAHFVPTPEALARATRRSYVAFCMSVAESFAMGKIPQSRFTPRWIELVDPFGVFANKPRIGATIFASVHCNWGLATAACYRMGLVNSIASVALPYGDERIDRIFADQRAVFHCRSLLLDRAPLAALRTLRAGEHLCLFSDRDYTNQGIPVTFAGDTSIFPVGAAALAVQTGVPVVPFMMARRSAERFVMVIGKPMHADTTIGKSHQVQAMTQALADVFTRFVAAAPAQWVGFHPVWKKSVHSELSISDKKLLQ